LSPGRLTGSGIRKERALRFFIDSFLGIRKSPGDGRPNAGKQREIQVKSASPAASTQALPSLARDKETNDH
ncbi:MAG: hypothetical protein J0H30_12220, partial [Alphaproteobacteria bacterium]|nr:hypothetical protein [Alphaproteobacteria bacterium]